MSDALTLETVVPSRSFSPAVAAQFVTGTDFNACTTIGDMVHRMMEMDIVIERLGQPVRHLVQAAPLTVLFICID